MIEPEVRHPHLAGIAIASAVGAARLSPNAIAVRRRGRAADIGQRNHRAALVAIEPALVGALIFSTYEVPEKMSRNVNLRTLKYVLIESAVTNIINKWRMYKSISI